MSTEPKATEIKKEVVKKQNNSIMLTPETNQLLNSLTKEMISIFWEKFETKDDIIVFLIDYYYKK